MCWCAMPWSAIVPVAGCPSGLTTPSTMPILTWMKPALTELMDRPAGELLAYHTDLHRRILAEFCLIRETEIDLPSFYWEDEPYPLRFRLGRFESHLRQHTIQIDKTLTALGRLPGEPLRLVRMVYAALAEAEGARLGAESLGAELVTDTAAKIAGWVREIGR